MNAKLLVLTTGGYPCEDCPVANTFVKAHVDAVKGFFRKVYVMSLNAYFPRFLKNVGIIPEFYRNYAKTHDYCYDNVEVFYPRYVTLPETRYAALRGAACYHAAVRCIRKHGLKFDLMHAHFTWPAGYVAARLKQSQNVKYVLTVHRNRKQFLEEYASNDRKLVYAWQQADLLTRPNAKDVPLLKRYNKKTLTIPNGYDESIFRVMATDVRKRLGLPPDRKILLHVGAYRIWQKNQINLIKAIQSLVMIRTDIVLYLVGAGQDRRRIEKEIENRGLCEYVKLIGPKPNEQIPLWMNAADLFVFPSYSESFGVVLIEALACGTPVVSTINGGSEEVIVSSDHGLLLDEPDDYDELAKMINCAVNKKWDREKLLSRAEEFKYTKIASQLMEHYNNLIE